MEYKFQGEWVQLRRTQYNYNDTLAVLIWKNKHDYDTQITICLDAKPLDSDCAFVDTKNFPDIENFLIINNIAEPTGRCHMENNRTYPEYRFIAYITYM